MAQTRTPKQQNYPRLHGMRRCERCRHCNQWTPIGTATTREEVLCPTCKPRFVQVPA